MAMPPAPFLFALAASNFIRRFGIFLLPVLCGLIWGDGKLYCHIHRTFGRAKARLYCWAITIFLGLLAGWFVWAAECPRFWMGEVVTIE